MNMEPKLEVIKSCPVCSSLACHHWANAKDLLMQTTQQQFEYSLCESCKSLFMSTRPTEDTIFLFYNSDYHPYSASHNKSTGSEKRKLRWLKRILTKCVLAPIHNIGRVNTERYYQFPLGVYVDFGCGAGKSLDIMRKKGHKTIGVDFSQVALQVVAARGHAVHTVDEFWSKVEDDSVDFVRMNHVVEHLYHPNQVMSKLAKKVKSGGYLHIAVPNPDGVSAKIFKNNWHGLDSPRHVILFPPKTLIRLVEKYGFAKVVLIQESITKDFIRSIGYWLASKNLYELSKVNQLMNNRWLAILFALPAKLLSMLGYGDRYHLFFKKK